MIGTSIFRWTMSYFAMAVAWLCVALALLIAGIDYPAADLAAPDTLLLVHVICIGWLSLAMCGALFQFVPVLVTKPLFSEKWAVPALGLHQHRPHLTGSWMSLILRRGAITSQEPSRWQFDDPCPSCRCPTQPTLKT